MPKQNKPLRHPHAAGKLYKVAVSILHYSRADHPCIPGPFDKYICQDHVLYVNAQQRNYSKNHDLTGERQHYIHYTHDQFFRNATKIPG